MATHSFIFAQENAIVGAVHAAIESLHAYRTEKRNGRAETGYSANKECWANLAVNARILRHRLTILLDELRPSSERGNQMSRPLYREMASTLQAINNCRKSANKEWEERHEKTLSDLCNALPSGSGIDCGTKLDRDACRPDRLVFTLSYHFMDENGFYCGWGDFVVYAKPSFDGIELRITGRDKNQVKEMLYDLYRCALTQEV